MTALLDLSAQAAAVDAAAAREPRNAALAQAARTLHELRRVSPEAEIWTGCHQCGVSYAVGQLRYFLPDGLWRATEGLLP